MYYGELENRELMNYQTTQTPLKLTEHFVFTTLGLGDTFNAMHLSAGFAPFFEQKIQGLFKDFQGLLRTHFAFFKTTFRSAKKSLESVFFSSSTSGEVFPEGLCVSSFSFAVLLNLFKLKVSTEIQGLSSTNCNFQDFQGIKIQGLSRCVGTLYLYHGDPY